MSFTIKNTHLYVYKTNYFVFTGHYDLPKSKKIYYKEIPLTVAHKCLSVILKCKEIGLLGIDQYFEFIYDFSNAPYHPYTHQVSTSFFLACCPRAMCCNDPGTGKTASCIWAYDMLRKEDIVKKLLIISPLSPTKAVWSAELKKLIPDTQHAILVGPKKTRITKLNKNLQVYIINHDGIKVLQRELLRWNPDLVIVDESTAFKHKRTARWKALRDITKKAKFVWLLTGTPTPQAPTDIYAQAFLICPESVGRSFVRFRDYVMLQVGMYSWIARDNADEIIRNLVRPIIRFNRQDCIDLPPMQYIDYEVSLSTSQKAVYKKLKAEAVYKIEKQEVVAINEAAMRSKLLQCCGGFVYSTYMSAVDLSPQPSTDKPVIDLSPQPRFTAVADLIAETTRGVLVFVPFVSILAPLRDFLARNFTVAVIDGSVPLTQRSEILDVFQRGDIQVLLAHPRTMGHGLTLTAADTVIWYIVTSDNEIYLQANARIHRIGQSHKTRVVHLVSTTLERRILKRLSQKQVMQGVLLEALATNANKL